MIQVDETLKKRLAEAAETSEEGPTPAGDLLRIVETLEKEGLQQMIDLDPYFGEVSVPLQEEMDRLAESHPEAFEFFRNLMADLREEMEIHFETMEMYEDEEFDQFVEDCRIMKERFGEELARNRMEDLHRLIEAVLD